MTARNSGAHALTSAILAAALLVAFACSGGGGGGGPATGLSKPSSLDAQGIGDVRIALHWPAEASAGEQWEVERSVKGKVFHPLAVLDGGVTTYVDTVPAPEKPFFYRLRKALPVAGGATQYSDYTDPVSAATVLGPTELMAQVLTDTEIVLSWTDHSGREAGFTVERSANGGAWKEAAVLPPDTTGFDDTGLDPGTSYAYRVRAFGPEGSVSDPAKLDAATPATPWARTYGEAAWDEAAAVIPMPEGDFLVAGSTRSFGAGADDCWVLRLDEAGGVLWEKSYGSPSEDYGHTLVPSAGGGMVVAGDTAGFGAFGSDAWVLALDGSGDVLWEQRYGGADYDHAAALAPAPGGGFLLAGETRSFGAGSGDGWLVALDAAGGVVWQEATGGALDDRLRDACAVPGGGFVAAGSTFSFGGGDADFWVVRLEEDGNVLWQHAYGGPGEDRAYAVAALEDGGFAVAGSTRSFGGGDADFWVLRLEEDGNVLWQKRYGDAGEDRARSIRTTAEGGFVVAGESGSFGAGDGDVWVLRLEEDGNVLWQKRYGGPGDDGPNRLAVRSDTALVLAGASDSFTGGQTDTWILNVNPNGTVAFNPSSGAIVEDTAVQGLDTTGVVTVAAATVQATSAVPADTQAVVEVTRCRVEQQAP